MAKRLKRGLSLLAALMQISAAVIVPSGHDHHEPQPGSRPPGPPAIASHDCGPVEQHHPVQQAFPCVLCQRQLQYVATHANCVNSKTDETELVRPVECEPLAAGSPTAHPQLRGPPSSI